MKTGERVPRRVTVSIRRVSYTHRVAVKTRQRCRTPRYQAVGRHANGVGSQSPGSAKVATRPERHPGYRWARVSIPQRGITEPCDANDVHHIGGSNVIRTHTVTCRTPAGCTRSHVHAYPGCAAGAATLGFGMPPRCGENRRARPSPRNRIYPSRVVYPPRCGENPPNGAAHRVSKRWHAHAKGVKSQSPGSAKVATRPERHPG